VGLEPASVSTDLGELEALLRRPELLQASASGALLQQACSLLRGDLLEGFYEEWVIERREAFGVTRLSLLDRLSSHLEAQGELERALELARQAQGIDPERESTYIQLMRLEAACGRPSLALKHYSRLKKMLKTCYGELPSDDARLLAARLRRQLGEAERTLLAVNQTGHLSLEQTAAALEPRGEESRPAESPWRDVPGLEPSRSDWMRSRSSAEELSVLVGVCPSEGGVSFHASRSLSTKTAAMGGMALEGTGLEGTGLDPIQKLLLAHGGALERGLEPGLLVAFSTPAKALLAVKGVLEAGGLSEGLRLALEVGPVTRAREGLVGRAFLQLESLLQASLPGQILCSERVTVLASPPPPGLFLQPLGSYYLAGEVQPERLFALELADGRSTLARVGARALAPSLLPRPSTAFIGRERELEQLKQWLLEKAARVVTLTGLGGTGKTRLAVELALRLSLQLPGSCFFVSVAELREAGQLLQALLDALQAGSSGEGDPLRALQHLLPARPVLLVLDNFEQLLPDGATLVNRLIQALPQVRLLVTSRVPLDLEAEWELPVPPLAIPSRVPTRDGELQPLLHNESVALFLDRVQRVQPDFRITLANAPALIELCRRLDGLPLALELAAARAPVLSPAQLLARWRERFELLSSRRQGLPQRHQTLRAVILASFQLLDPTTSRFFACLSLFRGSFSREAAEAVSGVSDALSCLEELRRHAFLVATLQGESTRFGLLETLRDFASDQLDAPARTACLSALVDFCLVLTEQHRSEIPQWLARLQLEQDTLRLALDATLDPLADPLRGLRLACTLFRFWQMRGQSEEAYARFQALLHHPRAPRDSFFWACAAWRAGYMAHRLGKASEATSLGRQGRESLFRLQQQGSDAEKARCTLELARANVMAAVLALETGRGRDADDILEDGALPLQALGDERARAVVAQNRGILALNLGRPLEAESFFRQSFNSYRVLGDQHGMCSSLLCYGIALMNRGELGLAREVTEEALGLARLLENDEQVAQVLNNLGHFLLKLGELDAARQHLEESLSIRQRLGNAVTSARTMANLAQLCLLEGALVEAEVRYREVLAIFEREKCPVDVVNTLCDLAQVAMAGDDVQSCRRFVAAAELERAALGLHLAPDDDEGLRRVKAWLEDRWEQEPLEENRVIPNRTRDSRQRVEGGWSGRGGR
jgi:predicted ATPase